MLSTATAPRIIRQALLLLLLPEVEEKEPDAGPRSLWGPERPPRGIWKPAAALPRGNSPLPGTWAAQVRGAVTVSRRRQRILLELLLVFQQQVLLQVC